MKLKPILEELYPLNRSLNTDDTEKALRQLSNLFPDSRLEGYTPGLKVWSWTIPERWKVAGARLMPLYDESYNSYFDISNPLNLISYSLPIEKIVDYEELAKHVHTAKGAVPWVYKYYDRDWGFCLQQELWEKFDKTIKYRVVIDTYFTNEPFHTLTAQIGDNPNEILLMAHICHAAQANDDLSGVVTLLEVAERLKSNPLPEGSLSVRFLIAPETIGSIAYLSRHEDVIPNIKAGIFAEMTGTDGDLWMHESGFGDDLDEIAFEEVDNVRSFGTEPANDERILHSLGIPCISINRWPYPEYHTSKDTPEIISEKQLQEAADVIERIVRIYASNYIPKLLYKGFPFLSGFGVFSAVNQKVVLFVDGKKNVFEIAQCVDIDYFAVYGALDELQKAGLIIRSENVTNNQ